MGRTVRENQKKGIRREKRKEKDSQLESHETQHESSPMKQTQRNQPTRLRETRKVFFFTEELLANSEVRTGLLFFYPHSGGCSRLGFGGALRLANARLR